MKKLYLFCLILLPLMMVSCKDESSNFIEQYYTNAELTSALRTCLTTAKDSALNHLCVPDGLNGSDTYRITLPDNANFRALAAALDSLNKSYLADSLVIQMNRAGEKSGNALSAAFNSSITSITFPDPSSIVYTTAYDAATTYFITNCGATIQSTATNILSEQMQNSGASTTWNEIQAAYYTVNSSFFNYDITSFATTTLLTNIYTEMAKEEKLIRTDETHASADNLAVFRN